MFRCLFSLLFPQHTRFISHLFITAGGLTSFFPEILLGEKGVSCNFFQVERASAFPRFRHLCTKGGYSVVDSLIHQSALFFDVS